MSDALIVSNPDIRGGEPVIAGTRFPVWQIQDMHDNGRDLAYMLDEYPALHGHEAGIAAALAYPRRREIVAAVSHVYGTIIVREATVPGLFEVACLDNKTDSDLQRIELPHAVIPSLIAALEQARGWEAT